MVAVGAVVGGTLPHFVGYALDRNHLNIVADTRTGRQTTHFIAYHAGQIVFVLRRDANRASFFFRLDNAPQMHDTVLDDHLLTGLRPAMIAGFARDRVVNFLVAECNR
jgi:hypothetical protein